MSLTTQQKAMLNKLTHKQEFFCREYLVDFNGTQAAIRAGYSAESAKQLAAENLTKHDVQAYLKALMDARADRLDRQADEVLARVWEVADLKMLGDVGDIVGGEFVVKNGDGWSESTCRVIRSVKSTKITRGDAETIELTVRAPEVMPALVELMKHYGLTSDFNQAIATLKKYGLLLKQNADGAWTVEDIDV
jgi:phage terminase small subunit